MMRRRQNKEQLVGEPESRSESGYLEISPEELPFSHLSATKTLAGYVAYSFSLAASIHLFFWFTGGRDPLATPLLQTGLLSIDAWSFVHVVNFMVVGLVFPRRMLAMTVYGVLWEALEHAAARTDAGRQLALQVQDSFWTELPLNSIWDLWFNTVGYWLGERLAYEWVLAKRRATAAAALKESCDDGAVDTSASLHYYIVIIILLGPWISSVALGLLFME